MYSKLKCFLPTFELFQNDTILTKLSLLYFFALNIHWMSASYYYGEQVITEASIHPLKVNYN